MKYFFFISAFLIFQAGCGTKEAEKYFTGTIEYTYTYSSDSLNGDSLSKLRPGKSDFRYDLYNYQSRFITRDTETYYYSGKLNKCLSARNNLKHYSCEDYSLVTDSVLSWKIYDTDELVLGQQCRILEMQKGNSWVRYYVSKKLKIAPATYRNHQSYNWDFYGEKAEGGLILKSEHRFKKFIMTGVAARIKKMKNNFVALELDEKLFAEICNKE